MNPSRPLIPPQRRHSALQVLAVVRYGSALRLDWQRHGGLLGRARLIYTF